MPIAKFFFISCSFIIHFLLEEKVGENAKVYFHCDRQEHKSSLVVSWYIEAFMFLYCNIVIL